MTIRRIVFSMIGLLLTGTTPVAFAADTYAVDPAHSSIVFRIKHLDIAYVFGRFNNVSGTLSFDPENDAGNSVRISVQAKDVDTGNAKRDAHLRGSDFFDSEQHAEIRFESETFKKTGENTYDISGTIHIMGTTQPVTVTAMKTGGGKDPWGGYRVGFTTTFTFQRSRFGMNNMLGSIGDDVELTVSVEAIRKQQ